MRCLVNVALLAAILAAALPADWTRAETPDRHARQVVVERFGNDQPAFFVGVDVDHPDRTYRGGDLMFVTVTSQKDGYLQLWYQAADGSLSCLFPNQHQKDNRIHATQKTVVPALAAPFRLRVAGPYGQETLKAIVTLRPMTPEQLGVRSLTESPVTPLDWQSAKAVIVELKQQPQTWAEHHVPITTLPPEDTGPETTTPETTTPETTTPEVTAPEVTAPPVRRTVRVGLFIGISTYRNTSDLPACQRDAQRMAEVFMQFGGVEKPIILINEQATRRDIERAIRRTLVETTQPGDEVIIYWSGHGSTMPDDNGDEPDGKDELLVPYDGQGGNLTTARRTMISDDVFGRWIQDLCGRNVVIILDTCYAAGMATGARSAPSRGPLRFDFLDNELSHTRDVGQGAALLCASSTKGYESNRLKHSVMTYYLIKLLEGSTDRISLIGAFRHLRTEVPQYVSNVDRTKTQIPVLYNFLASEFFLRP